MENIVNEVQTAFKSQFPSGYVNARIVNGLGTYIVVNIGLISDINDVNNKIRENDPMFHTFVVHPEKDGSYTAELAHGGLSVDPVEKYYAMSHVKTKWRKVAGNEAKIIKGFSNWFGKLKTIVEENQDKIYNREMYKNYI